MSNLPKCSKCNSESIYEDGSNYVCPECAHEWSKGAPAKNTAENKGSSSVVKVGTKVKNIRLVEGDHDIDCKIDGIGAMSRNRNSRRRHEASSRDT